jgi:hypothetical protein
MRTTPDTMVTLLTVVPSDSVVATRERYTIIVSAETAETNLRSHLSRYPHIRSDSLLLRTIQLGITHDGWVHLPATGGEAREREDFLLAALLEDGAAAIRLPGSRTLARTLLIKPWGTCNMVNGRRFLLPDSSEVLSTVDGWHMCPAL